MLTDELDSDCDLFDGSDAPLYSRYAERVVLGGMLIDAERIPSIVDGLAAEDFFEPMHAAMFRHFQRVAGDEAENTSTAILEAIGGNPEAEMFGYTAQQYIGHLTAVGFEHIGREDEAADIIRDTAERRFTGETNDIQWDEQFTSSMGLMLWEDQNDPNGEQYEFIVEDLIPERQGVLLIGETQTGKSFLGYHLGMCMARALPFFGRAIREPIGVIWLAFEASTGASARMRAYRRYHEIDLEPLPFAVLTKPLPLWPNELGSNEPQDPRDQRKRETATDKIIREVSAIQESFRKRFKCKKFVVLIDTYNAATPGASEIDSEVVSKIRGQFHQIITELQATLIIVGHTNSQGKHRGNEQLTNNFDTIIKVSRKTYQDGREIVQARDASRREIRTMKVVKQREGIDTASHDFVLHVVEDGTKNSFGKPRTSCVVTRPELKEGEEPAENGKKKIGPPRGYVQMNGPREFAVWQAYVNALKSKPTPTPAGTRAPKNEIGIMLADWRQELARSLDETEEADRIKLAKSRIGNFINKWGNRLLRGDNAFYWRTRLQVDGIDPPPKVEEHSEQYDFNPADFPPN